MKKLLVRSISGLAYVLVLIAAILFGKWGVFILGGLLLAMGIAEAIRLLQITIPKTLIFGLSLVVYCYLSFPVPIPGYWPAEILLVLIPLVFFSFLFLNPDTALEQSSKFCLLILYILIPLSLLNQLYMQLSQAQIPLLLLGVLAVIWINDSCAYLVGSMVGRKKLWYSVSPGKTWEGFAAGCAGAMAAGYFLSTNSAFLNPWQGVVFGLWISIMATMGDLFESALKRYAGVKDSGAVLPGHGGVLDRIDSILFVIPGVFGFLVLIQKINFS